jgi:hypothetical protein
MQFVEMSAQATAARRRLHEGTERPLRETVTVADTDGRDLGEERIR